MGRIVFSPPLVAAILDDRKTMTRRVLSLPTKIHDGGPIYEHPKMGGWEPTTNGGGGSFTIGKGGEKIPRRETVGIWHKTCGVCLDAPHQVGDRLAVAETHWAFGHWEHVQKKGRMGWQFVCDRPDDIRFEPVSAALPSMDKADPGISTWYKRNARFMPTRYARLYIEVTAVLVERLQDITEVDAVAEGIDEKAINHFGCPIKAFQALWNSLGRDDETEWAGNPWVTAIKFRRVS